MLGHKSVKKNRCPHLTNGFKEKSYKSSCVWTAISTFSYRRGNKTTVKHFTINQIYATKKEAEQAAQLFAKKWIDDGKPNINP